MVEKWLAHALSPEDCADLERRHWGRGSAALDSVSATQSSSSVGILPGGLPVGSMTGGLIFISLL